MPHEVIMPALGMAQETGQIVAWLKEEGAAVKAGDPIMEVETDKATMEVEASHDGFLTGIRAAAGDDVPVGNVVAVISESAEAPAPANGPDTASAPSPSPGTAPSPAPAGGKSVIMPALGMAQDSGVIVTWLKAPGDAVAAADPLLEVETDKATMEVEAGHDGFVAELRGHDGDAVPVGDVIAVISTEPPEAPCHLDLGEGGGGPAPQAEPAEAAAASDVAAAAAPPDPDPDRAARPAPPHAPEWRLLASPKAKRLAAERGLDLARLAEAGYPQPYHARDIETLAALPQAGAAAQPASAALRLTARAPASGFDALRDWLAGVLDGPVPAGGVLALAAAAALREARATTDALRIETGAAVLTDPDVTGLAALDDTGGAPDLRVTDLSATPITAIEDAADTVPTLTLTREGDALGLTLTAAGALERDAAIALLSGLAQRLDDPLRQLL